MVETFSRRLPGSSMKDPILLLRASTGPTVLRIPVNRGVRERAGDLRPKKGALHLMSALIAYLGIPTILAWLGSSVRTLLF